MNKNSTDILSDDLIEKYMREAINESHRNNKETDSCAEVPVGCIIIDKKGNIIARGHNTREHTNCVTGHAEINAVNEVAKKNESFLLCDATVFVTLEPCPMCAGALAAARPKALYYGAPNTENGSCGTVYNILNRHTKIYGGIFSQEIEKQLSVFFKNVRKNK